MRAFIFDTETTGLFENTTVRPDRLPEIIEFAGALVNLDTGEVETEYASLFRPEKSIPQEVINITHIDDDMVKDAPRFRERADQIKALLELSPVVIAHNVRFDRDMIDIEMRRLNLKVKWPRLLCTVEQTEHIRGWRLSLTSLYEILFNEKFVDAHRAEVDLRALIRVCVELRKRGML